MLRYWIKGCLVKQSSLGDIIGSVIYHYKFASLNRILQVRYFKVDLDWLIKKAERRILLSSSRSPVKTIYSYSADIAPFQTQPAYILPMGEGDSAGLASVATSDGNTLLFQGMDDGSVQAAIYGQAEEEVEIEVEWQKGVEKQAKKMLPRCPPGDLWVAKSKSDRKTRKGN